ncbi:MAG: TolC family protein [Chitinophagales bacterium]
MIVLKKTMPVYFLCAWLITSFAAYSQSSPSFSLSQYCDSAQHHLPLILQKMALTSAAKAGITYAKHAYLPNAFLADELNFGTDNSLPGSYFSFGIIPSSSNGIRSTNEYQSAVGNLAIFQTEYELFDFGLKKATVRNADAFANLSQADLEREIYLLKWQVGKLYFDILKNQFQLGIDKENVNRYQAIYNIILAVTRSGIRPGADSSLALAELSKSRINFNQTEGQIRQLQQELAYLSGIPVDQVSVDTAETQNYLSALNLLSRGIYVDSANNPLTDYYLKQKILNQEAEAIISKSYLPKLFLTGSGWARGSSIDYEGNYKSLSEGLGYQRFNYLLGATVVYDLFNGVRRKDKLTISRYNTLASEYDLQNQKLSLQNVNNKAEEAIRTSLKNLLEMPLQVKASEDAYDQKIAQYRAGIINLVDLTNASFVLYRAQSDYVETLSDWLLANLDKSAASGSIDLFIQSIKK